MFGRIQSSQTEGQVYSDTSPNEASVLAASDQKLISNFWLVMVDFKYAHLSHILQRED